jgi:hypothetical protein
MDDSAYIAEGIAGLFYLFAAIRLLRLALRTRKTPETLLGAGFLAWGSSYILTTLPYAFADESLIRPFYCIARLVTAVGMVTYAVFTWRVFRKHDTWGLWAVAGVSFCLIVGAAGSVWVGDWEGVYPISNPWWWVEWVGIIAAEAWIGAEACVQYGKMRQRLRLDMGDPLLCNRFLLLGIASILWMSLQFVIVVQYIEHEISQRWSPTMDLFVSGVEILAIAMIWLVFFPPAFYRSWINRGALAAKPARR